MKNFVLIIALLCCSLALTAERKPPKPKPVNTNRIAMLGCAIPASTNYLAGAEININFGSLGATYYLCITQIQLEAGTSYTAFDIQPPAVELARCQWRYWQSTPSLYGYLAQTLSPTGVGTIYAISFVTFPVAMAATPTVSAANGTWYATNCSATLTVAGITHDGCILYSTNTNAVSAVVCFYSNNSGYITASCDL